MQSRLVIALALLVCVVAAAAAQEKPSAATQRVTARVVSVTADAITLHTATTTNLVLTFDTTTRVVGKGVGTKAKAVKGEGQTLTVADLVGQYDSVNVKYVDEGGKLRATEIDIKVKAKRPDLAR